MCLQNYVYFVKYVHNAMMVDFRFFFAVYEASKHFFYSSFILFYFIWIIQCIMGKLDCGAQGLKKK